MDSARSTNDTASVDLGPFRATVALDAGPRIIGYARPGGSQLFARLPGETIEHPTAGVFSLLGGHRLWRAPEIPAVTYQPDDEPVTIDRSDRGTTLTGSPDADGIVKSISLYQRGSFTVVDHRLRHEGTRPVRCATWAITQLVPGGVAVLPHTQAPLDSDGVLPNRSIALWPYADLSAPELEFRRSEIRVMASSRTEKTKIGLQNRLGWIAYRLGDELFVKWAPLHRDGWEYPDLGSSVECYRDHRFLELESVGPLTDLQPGREVRHREVWTLTRLRDVPLDDVLASLARDPLKQ